MKRSTSIAIILMVSMLAMPASSHAFNNLLEIYMGGGSGDATGAGEADVDMGMFGAEYTMYFTALETTEDPYAMREFLQHPSYLNLGLESQTMETTFAGGGTMEDTSGTISIGGMFYLPNGTGLGGTLSSTGGEEKSPGGTDDLTETSVVLSLDHYVSDNTSFSVDLNSISSETKDDSGAIVKDDTYDQKTIDIRGSTLINNKIWVTGLVGFGEQEMENGTSLDVSRFELEAGMFPMQKLGVFIGVGTEKIEGDNSESTETYSMLSADYSLSESINIMAAFIKHKMEEDGGGGAMEVDITMLQLAMGILF